MTKLFGVIDGLLVGTRFLAWGIAMLGIAGSVVLMVANLPLGLSSAAVFLAALLAAAGVGALLAPKGLLKNKFSGRGRHFFGACTLLAAVAVMFFVYSSAGGFPSVNLLFV